MIMKVAENIFVKLLKIARSIFGYERIIFWTTYGSEEETNAHYTWKEVYELARLESKSNKKTTTGKSILYRIMINEANKFAVSSILYKN